MCCLSNILIGPESPLGPVKRCQLFLGEDPGRWAQTTYVQRSYTPRSGMLRSASLKRLVKLAAQITNVNSTICPSS